MPGVEYGEDHEHRYASSENGKQNVSKAYESPVALSDGLKFGAQPLHLLWLIVGYDSYWRDNSMPQI
jgi:hypothetical protein